jgi:rhodanese-related sulfurtransferase
MKSKLLLLVFSSFLALTGLAQSANEAERRPLLPFDKFTEVFDKAGDQAQVLDARSAEEYEQNHVKGAINVDTEERFEKVAATLDKNLPVFVYSIGNGRSGRLAKQLDQKGFTRVYEIPGGLSKWIGEGKPVVSTVGEGLTIDEYQKLVAKDEWVLVDVTSRYCPGCKRLDPVLESFEKEVSGKVKVVKIEAYENKKLTKDLQVKGLPTLLLYKDGKVVWIKSGLVSQDELIAKIVE